MTVPAVLVLAAGEGTRMKSSLPKVLHEAAGEPLLEHVFRAAAPLRGPVGVVVGHGAERVRERYAGRCLFFLQKRRLGSGDAVKSAAAWLKRRGGDVVVLCGDAPLIRPGTLKRLTAVHRREKNAVTLLTARVSDPFGYGRIVRDAVGRPRAIVEHRDATPEQRRIDEINSGMYCFRAKDLRAALKRLRPDNEKKEYYLTDAVAFLADRGRPVGALCLDSEEEVLGVNRRSELAAADKILRRRTLEKLMAAGVTVVDPDSTYVDAGVRVGRDTVLYPQTFLKGRTAVGRGGRIGPFSFLQDCRVGDDAELRAVFAYGSVVGPGARVGPFTHLRPGTRIGAGARVGNFVETKNSRVGPKSKVSHLSYVGDAVLGADVNVGAGAITCNYDGFRKHRTHIGSGAFVGSNANLVAPVRVGRGAIVGAGSTIVRDVPADALALERATEIVKKGWARRKRRELARIKAAE
ncbi:MAG TPA: bifunctional UDP-N-acetylglucosamine diphosphorylase/glucosamine-1-phosphate N-acetyltransferase GlmU [Elusimicrobiota bacterium]|nr:bifunctional UDP-N-acetylglucosamine diphosphorylase/glucosamine-1-phosphate N-acetyltransferase GlmU [Elusimicrobiota bacterium]